MKVACIFNPAINRQVSKLYGTLSRAVGGRPLTSTRVSCRWEWDVLVSYIFPTWRELCMKTREWVLLQAITVKLWLMLLPPYTITLANELILFFHRFC